MLDALQIDEQQHKPQMLLSLLDTHEDTVRAQADAELATRLGWALYRARRFDQAARWFALALSKDGGDASARQGEFYALQQAGNLQRAFHAAAGDAALQSARADVALQLALRARDRDDPAEAVHWLREAIALGKDDEDTRSLLAWSLLQSGQAAEAADVFVPLYAARPQDPNLAQGVYLSLTRSQQSGRLHALAAPGGALADLLRRQRALHRRDLGLARDAAVLDPGADPLLAGADAPHVAIGGEVRDKSGAAGTSQLRAQQAPALHLQWTNHLGAWDLHLANYSLDAGAPPPAGQVGTTLPGSQGSAAGVSPGQSVELQWRQLGPAGWTGAIGVTPTNGAVAATWIGALGWRSVGSDHDWRIELQRRQVNDSVLAIAGLRDPGTGLTWGRVMRNSLSLGGYQALWPQWNGSAQLRWAHLKGVQVASNTQVAASFGVSRDISLSGFRYFSLGPVVSYERYARNLSGFTWGHGGYFSPQGLISVAMQGIFETHPVKNWLLAGQLQLGWQSLREDASPCFALMPPVTVPVCAPIAASRSWGIASSTALQTSVLLSPYWALEARVQLRTGPAYQDRAVYLGLRHSFAPRKALFSSDWPNRPRD